MLEMKINFNKSIIPSLMSVPFNSVKVVNRERTRVRTH